MFYVRIIKYVILIAVFAYGTYLCLINNQIVEFKLPAPFNRSIQTQSGYTLIGAFAVGSLLSAAQFSLEYFKKSTQLRRAMKKLKKVDPEHEES